MVMFFGWDLIPCTIKNASGLCACDASDSNASYLCHQGLFWYGAIILVGDIIL